MNDDLLLPQEDRDNRTLYKRPVSAKVRESSNSALSRKSKNGFPSFRPGNRNNFDSKNSLGKSGELKRKKIYEENICLKIKINSLSEDNTKIKTQINQIERSLKTVNDSSSKKSLVANLKEKIKELKETLKKKQEKLEKVKKHKKNCRMNEIEVEVQTYADECTRLRRHLEEITQQRGISIESLECQEKLFRLFKDFESLRRENLEHNDFISAAREEILELKEKVAVAESSPKKRRKSFGQKNQLNRLKAEIIEFKEKIVNDKQFFIEEEETLKRKLEELEKNGESLSKKIYATELKLNEQNIILEQLKSQSLKTEKELKRAQTILVTSKTKPKTEKSRNPPRLFQKIFNIASKKHLDTNVFFSLMDKNSNGVLDIEEIYLSLKSHKYKIKKKYIEEAFKVMEIEGNSISLSLLEEKYEEYIYEPIDDVESSSEEIPEPKKPVVERLTYNKVTPNLPEGLIIPDINYIGPSVQRVEVKSIDIYDISHIIKEIRIKLQRKGLLKSKLLDHLFDENSREVKEVSVNSLSEMFYKSSLDLKNKENNLKLAKFLIQPEGKFEYPEDELKYARVGLLSICKKILKLFDDWKIFPDGNFFHVIEGLKSSLFEHSNDFLEECRKVDEKRSGKVRLNELMAICNKLGVFVKPDSWEIWEIEIFPEKEVYYQDLIIIEKNNR
jgi:hypothetical protein